jgi:hypothetical protein
MNSANHPNYFPYETLASIFELLYFPNISSPGDLHSCALVNRHWHNVAMPILWRTLHLDVDGKEVKDVLRDPTRTGYKSIRGDEEIWSDWDQWLDYGNTASPTTDCWGDNLPRPPYANMLGVRPHNLDLLFRSAQCLSRQNRPFWMTYNSPFQLCRKITISFVDDLNSAENKNRIIFILSSCTKLLDFDMFLHLQKAPTPYERNAWTILACRLSSQPLRTLRIRLKWAKLELLPIFLNPSETTNQPGLSFDILRNRLTHLSLELDHPDVVIPPEANFSNFERLKFFAVYQCPDYYSAKLPSKTIKRLLQSVQVEEMGFSWPLNIMTLPLTLTKLSIVTSMNGFHLIPILKQLVNLEIFKSKDAQHYWDNSDEVQRIQNQSVEHEVIGCRRLRVLHFDGDIPKFFFQVVTSQCPLLSDINLTALVPEAEMCVGIDQCKALHSITLAHHTSNDVLSYLRFSKNLVNIALYKDDLPDLVTLKSFLKELPLLRHLYILEWFEDDSEFNFQEMVSDDDWTEAEVDHLRPYMKPHPDGHDYMYLDMRFMRNKYWMNNMN